MEKCTKKKSMCWDRGCLLCIIFYVCRKVPYIAFCWLNKLLNGHFYCEKFFFLLYRFNFEFFLVNRSWGGIRILFQLWICKMSFLQKSWLTKNREVLSLLPFTLPSTHLHFLLPFLICLHCFDTIYMLITPKFLFLTIVSEIQTYVSHCFLNFSIEITHWHFSHPVRTSSLSTSPFP